MRVLRITDEANFAVEFHPYVSVVTGATPAQRERIIEVLVAAARGRDVGAGGLIEAHDVIMDLDPSFFELLDLAEVDLDTVVTAADLPGSAHTGTAKQLQNAEAELRDAEAAVRAARERAEDTEHALELAEAAEADTRQRAERAREAAENGGQRLVELEAEIEAAAVAVSSHDEPIADAKRALADAVAEREALSAEVGSMRAALDAAQQRVHDAEAAVVDAKSRRDPFGGAARDAAVLALEELTEEFARERELEEAARREKEAENLEPPDEQLARLVTEEERLRSAIDAGSSFEPHAVRDALEVHLRGGDLAMLVPSPKALALAEQLESVERTLAAAGLAASEAPTPRERDEAQAALVAAQEDLFAAERAVRMPQIEPADVDELEQAHAALLAALDKVEGRFGGERAQRRVEEARETERAVLDRLGFNTYADYMMGTSILHVDADQETRLADARDALAAAEERVREVESKLDGELELAALVNRRQNLRAEARSLVGDDPTDNDLVYALQQLRVPDDPDFNPLGDLQRALEGVGLTVASEAFGGRELVKLAERWLREYHDTEAVREEARVRLQVVLEEQREARERLAEWEARAEVPDPEVARAARLGAARDAVARAEERVRAHQQAEDDLAEATARLETATDALERARVDSGDIDERERAADAAVVAAELELEQRRAAKAADVEAFDALERQVIELEAEFEAAATTDFDEEIANAEGAVLRAEADRSSATAALTVADAAFQAANGEVTNLRTAIAEAAGVAPPADEIEWYLLARLAGQRQVSFAGSIPLVLVDALSEVHEGDLGHLLDRLERMAGAVQVVHVTDQPGVLEWAARAGEQRVAIVSPVAPRSFAEV